MSKSLICYLVAILMNAVGAGYAILVYNTVLVPTGTEVFSFYGLSILFPTIFLCLLSISVARYAHTYIEC